MRIGVVIPVRGFSPYLAQTLDAVLAQTAPAEDVVVVDDGSRPPLRLAAEHAGRVRIVRMDRPRGPGSARNVGVAALHDDIEHVAFCNHDDVWGPGHLAAVARVAVQYADARVFVGDATVVGPDDRPIGDRRVGLRPGAHRWFLTLPIVYERVPLALSATVVRRDVLEGVGGFDAGLEQAEDLDLWFRLMTDDAEVVSVLGATVRLRRHPGGDVRDPDGLIRARMEVRRRYAGTVRASVARRVESADLRALGAGLARAGAYGDARVAYERADALMPPLPADRLRRAFLAVPGLRSWAS